MRIKGYYMWGQCIYGQDFHEVHTCLRGSNNLQALYSRGTKVEKMLTLAP